MFRSLLSLQQGRSPSLDAAHPAVRHEAGIHAWEHDPSAITQGWREMKRVGARRQTRSRRFLFEGWDFGVVAPNLHAILQHSISRPSFSEPAAFLNHHECSQLN